MSDLTFKQFQETGMDFGDGFHTYYPELREINDSSVEIQFIPSAKRNAETDFIDYEPIPKIEGAYIGRGSFLFSVIAEQSLVPALPELERALFDFLGEHNQPGMQ